MWQPYNLKGANVNWRRLRTMRHKVRCKSKAEKMPILSWSVEKTSIKVVWYTLHMLYILKYSNNATWTLDIIYLFGICDHEIRINWEHNVAICTSIAVVRWRLHATESIQTASKAVGWGVYFQKFMKGPANATRPFALRASLWKPFSTKFFK